MPLTLAIFLLSAAALILEILLMRLFSIAEWHHFAWMVISLALLGYASAGTVVAIFRRPILRHARVALIAFAAFAAFSVPISVAVARQVRFNSLELVWDWRQILRLAAMYTVLSVPFFAIASFIGTALTAMRSAVSRLYRADLLGAGTGAAAAIALLFATDVTGALRIVTAAAAIAAILMAAGGRRRARVFGVTIGAAAIAASLLWPASLLRVPMSQYKDLAAALRIRGATIVEEHAGPMALVDVVASDVVPLRHAPGLSLSFPGELPRQTGVFADGKLVTAVPVMEAGRVAPQYSSYLTSAAAHALCDIRGQRVLVIGADAPAVLDALGHGAAFIDVVEPDAQLIRAVGKLLRGRSGVAKVAFHCAGARAFLRGSRDRWRLIEMTIPSGGGETGLRENYLLTTEGISRLVRSLDGSGVLAITGGARVPPNEMMKLIMTAGAAGDAQRIDVRRSMAVIRSWSTATLLLRREPPAGSELEALAKFCDERSFDLDFPPMDGGMPANVMDAPYLAEAAAAAAGGQAARSELASRYKFDITPASDSRPFFFHFFTWRAFPDLIATRDRGGAPLIESAYLVVLAALVQAIAAAALLVVAPLALSRRAERPSAMAALYFAAIGTGFLFVEIALLQTMTLLLSHPLYAASVVLGSFLAFAGVGSGLTRSIAPHAKAWSWIFVAIAGGAAAYVVVLPRLFSAAATGGVWRVALAVAAVAPLAVLMGMPFAHGVSLFGRDRRGAIPWFWAINGSASVISAVLAMLLAIAAGTDIVMFAAAGCYLVALVSASRYRRQPSIGIGQSDARSGIVAA